jgi:hypothetical protein
MPTVNEPRFSIGTQFKPLGKEYICSVIDILKTYNSANQLVLVRYVAAHAFCGQEIVEHDVCDTTIARSLIK